MKETSISIRSHEAISFLSSLPSCGSRTAPVNNEGQRAHLRGRVRYCRENADNAATDAILALLYFGMRQSELATMRVIDGKWLEIETSKERLGQDIVLRRAPFTPMVQKVLPLIDFEKARTTNARTIASTIKRVLPDHHVHELRHTYVSRCKECGVAGEVVSIWVGHSLTGTITSTVYTHYSEEFQRREAEKVNYAL